MNTISRINLGILALLVICASTLATAHNKVVVIPMFDDLPAKQPAPVPEISQPIGEYFVYSDRVLDEVTNLLWQRSPGPAPANYTWQEAWDYCRTLDINGQSGRWRLPEPYELITIVDYTRRAPTISVNSFPDTPYFSWPYWTNQQRTYTIGFEFNAAFVVDFYEGGLEAELLTNRAEVRCVLGDILPSGQALHDNLDGTVSDLVTSLTWQQSADTMNWQSANNYCENLQLGGKQNWRLPTVKELVSIYNFGSRLGQHRVFREHPTSLAGAYWSSTNNVSNTLEYWNSSHFVRSREGSAIGVFRCVSD